MAATTDEIESQPLLKDIFNPAALEAIADVVKAEHRAFDGERFLTLTHDGLDALSLMQRVRRVAESLNAGLGLDFAEALPVVRALGPRIPGGLVSLILPDYVALYGQGHFDEAMEALAFLTRFGSSEFAVRHFLRADPMQGLAIMERWALDADEHVRRLASEGARPRLPWSFRIPALMVAPPAGERILEALKADPSLYVRKSVANHLNDIAKDQPEWVLERIEGWPLEDARAMWIARRALRTLIKQGDRRALSVVGAGEEPEVRIDGLTVSPAQVRLGGAITLSFTVRSLAERGQRLVIDYAIHYRKKTGATSAKVFKLKELALPAGASEPIARRQAIRDFTTRKHYPGRHAVEVMVNGVVLGRTGFELLD